MAHTKEEYEAHILKSSARELAGAPVADSHYTFAIQRCGGSFAQWRAANGRNDRLRFVFDLASKDERYEIANKFFAGIKDAERIQNGIEQWFEPEPNGVSFESRKQTHQLLAADMLAWTIATVRARQIFMRGRFVEVFWLAKVFVDTEHIKIGYLAKATLDGTGCASTAFVGSTPSTVPEPGTIGLLRNWFGGNRWFGSPPLADLIQLPSSL
jgi:hypothetical protein